MFVVSNKICCLTDTLNAWQRDILPLADPQIIPSLGSEAYCLLQSLAGIMAVAASTFHLSHRTNPIKPYVVRHDEGARLVAHWSRSMPPDGTTSAIRLRGP